MQDLWSIGMISELVYRLECFVWFVRVLSSSLTFLPTAAALYYLAELVEEYTSTVAKVIRYWIWASKLFIH